MKIKQPNALNQCSGLSIPTVQESGVSEQDRQPATNDKTKQIEAKMSNTQQMITPHMAMSYYRSKATTRSKATWPLVRT